MKYPYDKIAKSLLIVLAEAGYSWHEVMKFPAMLNERSSGCTWQETTNSLTLTERSSTMGRKRKAYSPRVLYMSWDEIPVLIDVAMACNLLGFSVEKVRDMCSSGELPAAKFGAEWRIEKDALINMVRGVEQ